MTEVPTTQIAATTPVAEPLPTNPSAPPTLPNDTEKAEAAKLPERTRDRQIQEIGHVGMTNAAQIGKQAVDEINVILDDDARNQFLQNPVNRLRVLLHNVAGRDYVNPQQPIEYFGENGLPNENTPYQLQVDHKGQAYHVTTITGIKIGEAGAPDIFTVKLENKTEPVEIPLTALVGAFLNQFLDKIAPTLPPEQAKMLRLYQAVLNNEAADLPPDTDTTLDEAIKQSGLVSDDHLKGFSGKLLQQETIPADAKPEERAAIEATNAKNAQKTAAVEKILAGKKVIDYDDMAAFCDVLGVNTENVTVLIDDAQTRARQLESYTQTDGFKKESDEKKIQIKHALAQAQAEAEVYEQAGNALHEGNAFGEFFYRQAHGDITPEQGQTLAAGLQNGDTKPLIDFALSSYEKAIDVKVKKTDAEEKFRRGFDRGLKTIGSVAGLSALFLFMSILDANKPKQGG